MQNSSTKITIDDCHEILRKKLKCSDYELLNFELRSFSEEKFGFICEHDTLSIDVRCNGATTRERFFVKSVSLNEAQRKMCIETKSFLKEELMFTSIRSVLLKHGVTIINDCIPECYLIRSNECIVLEDLTARGYKVLNPRESLDLDKVKVALCSIAKFHACCLILEEKLSKSSGNSYSMLKHFEEAFGEMFYCSAKPCVEYMKSSKLTLATEIDLFANGNWKISPKVFNERAQNILDRFYEFVKPSTVFRNTMCHGDTWSNNLMFRFENDKPVHCYLVDLQCYRYCPPAHDVMAFIYWTTDDAFREKHLVESLDYYHSQLGGILADFGLDVEAIVSREEFAESCEYYKAFAVMQAVTEYCNIMMTPSMVNEIFQASGNSGVFVEDRSQQLLQLCSKDPVYKEKQREAIENLRVLCESQNL